MIYVPFHRFMLLIFLVLLVVLSLTASAAVNNNSNNSNNSNSNNSTNSSICSLAIPLTVIDRSTKVIIAHRGASYHLPEHTLAAYQLALELGADYIEPDVVGTKDGHLIAIHSMDLNITTNVRDIFPNRSNTTQFHNLNINQNQTLTGFWSFDFTLAEIKQLKVHQRVQGRSTAYDGIFTIPTLEEILDLLHTWNTITLPTLTTENPQLRRAGIYVELKDPEWYEQQTHLQLSNLLYETISSKSYYMDDNACATHKFDHYIIPLLVVQCFDGETLKKVAEIFEANMTHHHPPLVILVGEGACLQDDFWFHVGQWRDFLSGIGPDKACLTESIHRQFTNRAKEHDLVIHAWTERPALVDVIPLKNMTEQEEMTYLVCTVGVDGLFTEDVTTMRVVLEQGCERSPTLTPTVLLRPQDQDECPPIPENMSAEYGAASGVMGLLIGSVMAVWLSQSTLCTTCCGRRGRGAKRQLRIPQHDDLEMI